MGRPALVLVVIHCIGEEFKLTDETKKEEYIKIFRNNGFNCFPIKRYDDDEKTPKKADHRYKASRTELNQEIKEDENYGIIPIKDKGTVILDFDNKEEYREFAEYNIENGFMVIETGQGWHIPVKGLSGMIQKVELFNYNIQTKKIIEIQGFDHFVMGVKSTIFHDELLKHVTYENKGTLKIWDAKGMDFHKLVDSIIKKCDVTGKTKSSQRATNQYQRKRFLNGDPPTKGFSNDYFFQASLQCNTDGLTKGEALKKIKVVYDKWENTLQFSGRPWSNIEVKVNEVYDNDKKISSGRPSKEKDEDLGLLIAKKILSKDDIYSNEDTKEIFRNAGGFLEKINNSLHKELQPIYPTLYQKLYNDILFKLVGLAENIPKTNINLYVFKNGVLNSIEKSLVETTELADMGFKQYNYLEKTEENEPKEFIKILFENVPETEHPRIKAGLRGILKNSLDPKISIIIGYSGVGKSTPLNILVRVLGEQYALTVELEQFLDDHFIRGELSGIRLLIFQDTPKVWKKFNILKTMTGETKKTERAFQKKPDTFDNKLKIWASGNYLPVIPLEEKDPMYTRRLSLIHNTRTTAYKEDPELEPRIAKDEGEKIISWILNLDDEECKYEDKKTVKKEWEDIASPELIYLEKYYEPSTDYTTDHSVISLVRNLKEKTGRDVTIDQMVNGLKNLGYELKWNIIKNLKEKTTIKHTPENKINSTLFPSENS